MPDPAQAAPRPFPGVAAPRSPAQRVSEEASLERCARLGQLAKSRAWAAFGGAWRAPLHRPNPEHWGKLRHALRHALPDGPGQENSPGSEWFLAREALASDPEWIREGVRLCGFWCERPREHNLGWAVAELEMAALGSIPEDNPEARHRLAAWLAGRRAPPEELEAAASWGLPALDWLDQGILSSVWSAACWRLALCPTSRAWLERSARSAAAFAERALFSPEDAQAEISRIFSDEAKGAAHSANDDAIALIALMEAFPAEARAAAASGGAGLRFVRGARERLSEPLGAAETPFLEQALARVEAAELSALARPEASWAPETGENAARAKAPRL